MMNVKQIFINRQMSGHILSLLFHRSLLLLFFTYFILIVIL